MNHQKGAALIVVLSMLAASLMLGLTSMQSALIDERLAGNYRASTLAHMAAEKGIADFISDSDMVESAFEDDEKLQDLDGAYFLYGGYKVKSSKGASDELVLISEGVYGLSGVGAKRFVTAVIERGGVNSSNYLGMVACEGGAFSGGRGSVFDGYDSREGAYGENGNNTNDARLISLLEGGRISMDMGRAATFKGDILSAGDVEVKNTQPILGSVHAMGDVILKGNNALITGDVTSDNGKVTFEVGTRVDGSVSAKEKVAIYGNWGEVRAYEGNNVNRQGTSSAVGGDVISDSIYVGEKWQESNATIEDIEDFEEALNRVEGDLRRESHDATFPSSELSGLSLVGEVGECPGYGVNDKYNEHNPAPSKGNVNMGHWAMRDIGFHLGKDVGYVSNSGVDVYHVDNFDVGGIGFSIDKPTVIIADGDVNFRHYGDIEISEGAYLEIVTSGTFTSGNGTITASSERPLTEVGEMLKPTFSIFSSYQGASDGQAGVVIRGDQKIYGQIVAPYSKVSLTGSGEVFGAINAGYLDVAGGAAVHYDHAFSTLGSSGGNGKGELVILSYCESLDELGGGCQSF